MTDQTFLGEVELSIYRSEILDENAQELHRGELYAFFLNYNNDQPDISWKLEWEEPQTMNCKVKITMHPFKARQLCEEHSLLPQNEIEKIDKEDEWVLLNIEVMEKQDMFRFGIVSCVEINEGIRR